MGNLDFTFPEANISLWKIQSIFIMGEVLDYYYYSKRAPH